MGRPRLYTPEEKKFRDRESCARYRARTRPFHRTRGADYRSRNRDAINARARVNYAALKKVAIKSDGEKCCRTCLTIKPLSQFWKHLGAKDGRRSECVACLKPKRAAYYSNNRDALRAQQHRLYHSKIEAHRKYDKKRRAENPELFRQRSRARFQRHKNRIRVRNRNRRHRDMSYRVECNLRGRITTLLRRYIQRGKSAKKADNTEKLLGCSFEDFVIYLESKWETGMTWQNYGVHGWHVDHIMPCAIFDLSKPEHQKRCFHFSNLQPLWAAENISKNAKVLDEQFRLI